MGPTGECSAHLREGAGRQLLLQQCAQYLILPLQVKHPLLQLDTLLPQVLSTQEGQETKVRKQERRATSRPSQLYSQLQPLGKSALGLLS